MRWSEGCWATVCLDTVQAHTTVTGTFGQGTLITLGPGGGPGARGVREQWRARPPRVVVSQKNCELEEKTEF